MRANGAGSNQPPLVAAGDAPEASVLATQWGQVGKPRVLLRTRGRTRGRFGEHTLCGRATTVVCTHSGSPASLPARKLCPGPQPRCGAAVNALSPVISGLVGARPGSG